MIPAKARFQIRFTPKDLERLRQIGEEKQLPVADVVRRAISDWLDQQAVPGPSKDKLCTTTPPNQ